MRLNYTDARRGSKQADLCDDCAGEMPGQQWPAGGVGRRRSRRPDRGQVAPGHRAARPKRTTFSRSLRTEARTKARRGRGLRWTNGSLARRGAGACRQGRAAPGALPRRARARSVARRPEPGRTSNASSVTCSGGGRRCSRARSGLSTTVPATSPTAPTMRVRSQPRPSARSPSGARSAACTGRSAPLRDDVGASPTRCSALAELEAGLVEPDGLDGELAALARAYREELGRTRPLGSRRHARRCGRATCAATWTRGTERPSSPTASRT